MVSGTRSESGGSCARRILKADPPLQQRQQRLRHQARQAAVDPQVQLRHALGARARRPLIVSGEML